MAIGCFAIDKKDSKQPKRAFLINFIMFTCFFSFYYTFVFRALPEAGYKNF